MRRSNGGEKGFIMRNAVKKILIIFMVLCCVPVPYSMGAGLSISEGTIILRLDSNRAAVNNLLTVVDENKDVVPFTENDRTLVPLRFISEAFGAEVSWADNTRIITIEINKKKIFFQIDNYTMYNDSVPVELEAPPRIINSKTFVPLRALAEGLYKNVCFESGFIVITDSNVRWEEVPEGDRHAVYDVFLDGSYSDEISEEAVIPPFVPMENSKYFKGNPLSTNSYLLNGSVVLPYNVVKDVAYKKFIENLNSKGIKIKRLEQPLILSQDDVLYTMEVTGNKTITLEEVSDNVADFAMGHRFALVLKKDGSLFARTDMTDTAFVPILIRGIDFDLDKRVIRGRSIKNLTNEVQSIFAGRETCFAIKKDGTLWAWGSNLKGKLGDGTEIDKTADEPVEIKGIPEPQFIASATNHTLCIDKEGNLWGWGLNDKSELTSEFFKTTLKPKRFTGISDVKYVATASDYTMVVKKDGTVWVAGDNDRGKLGVPDIRRALTFTQVPGLADIVYAKANDHYYPVGNSMVVNKSGEVFAWGTAVPTVTAVYTGIQNIKITKLDVLLDVSAALE